MALGGITCLYSCTVSYESYVHYDIIQGLISCCIAMLVRKILGDSRLVC
jgi:hypothetical protein